MKAETLNADRTIHWLLKTIKTIKNMPAVNSMENYKANQLATRYNDLRDRAKHLGIWIAYCDNNGFSRDHNGYDLFA